MSSWSKDPTTLLLEAAQAQFDAMDIDSSGYIEPWELKAALQKMGLSVTGEDVAESLAYIGLGPEDAVDRGTWMTLCVSNKELISRKQKTKQETIQVFQALGGVYEDATTGIDTEKLNTTLKAFEMESDVNKLMEELDTDHSKVVEYNELDDFLKVSAMINTDLNDPDNPFLRNSLEELHKFKQENAWIEPKVRSRELQRRRTKMQILEHETLVDKDPFGRLRWLEQLDRALVQNQKNQRKIAQDKLRAVLAPDHAAALAKKKLGWGSTMNSLAKKPMPTRISAGFRSIDHGATEGSQKRRPSSIGLGVNTYTFGKQDHSALTSQEWRQYLETPAPDPSNVPPPPASPKAQDKVPKKRGPTAGHGGHGQIGHGQSGHNLVQSLAGSSKGLPRPGQGNTTMARSSSASSLSESLKQRPQTSMY